MVSLAKLVEKMRKHLKYQLSKGKKSIELLMAPVGSMTAAKSCLDPLHVCSYELSHVETSREL